MCESSDSCFIRTTTEIQSGADTFDKSRLVKAFLSDVGVKRLLCIFILVLEGKAGEEILKSSRLYFLETFSGNNFLYQM